MVNKVQLIAYINRIGDGTISDFQYLLDHSFSSIFKGGVHLLPFYSPIDGSDAGFDPIDHLSVDDQLGNWNDIRNLANNHLLMVDVIVNHISANSKEFIDVREHGKSSEFFDLFLTREKVYPDGISGDDLTKIYRPRPSNPFTEIVVGEGEKYAFWTTFTANQIDIDVLHKKGEKYLDSILQTLSQNGIQLIRLDAAGYAVKKQGTTCFMIPQTHDFIRSFSEKARQLGIEVLVEIHTHYLKQIEIASQVGYVYDFALPPLILYTINSHSAKQLKHWLSISPRNCFTVLDTHDGIGIIDAAGDSMHPGLLLNAEIDVLVESIHQNSHGESSIASGEGGANVDIYQVNCSFYDALGKNDNHYLMARAIQFFSPGIPQVYYGGFLAAENDMDLINKTGVFRDINRPYISRNDVEIGLKKGVVKGLIKLIAFRNDHPSFNGNFEVASSSDDTLKLQWNLDKVWSELFINLAEQTMEITFGDYTCSEQLNITI